MWVSENLVWPLPFLEKPRRLFLTVQNLSIVLVAVRTHTSRGVTAGLPYRISAEHFLVSEHVLLRTYKTLTSSMNTKHSVPTKFFRTVSMSRWKFVGLFESPKGSRLNL